MANFDGGAAFSPSHNSSGGETPNYNGSRFNGPRPMGDVNAHTIRQGAFTHNGANYSHGLPNGQEHPNQRNFVSLGHTRTKSSVTKPSTHHNNTPVSSARSVPSHLRHNPDENMSRRISQQQLLQQQQLQMYQQQQPHNISGSGQDKPVVTDVTAQDSINRDTRVDKGTKGLGPGLGQTQNQNQTQNQGQGQGQGQGQSQSQSQSQNQKQDGPEEANAKTTNPDDAPNAASRQQDALNARIARRNMGNAAIMRIMDLVESVSSAPPDALSSIGFWVRVCDAFFRPSSTMRFSSPFARDAGAKSELSSAQNQYQINMATAPHFLLTQSVAHNVRKHEIFLAGFRFQLIPGGFVILVCRINAIFHYKDGSSGSTTGSCRFLVSRDLFIHQLDCRMSTYEKTLSLDALERRWNAYTGSQNAHANQADFIQQMVSGAESSKNAASAGLSRGAMRLLQIGDVMACLHPLVQFARSSNNNSPLAALDTLTSNFQKALRRPSKASTLNAELSSPSPKTVMPDEPKSLKKRKMSSSFNSPMPR